CLAWLLGPTFLPLLFTHQYQGAVPLFLLTTLEFVSAILPTDALLRAAGDTRFLFLASLARVISTAALVTVGIRVGGLSGAVLGAVTSGVLARLVMLLRGRRFFPDTPLAELVGAARLGRVAGAAALAAVPPFALKLVLPPSVAAVVIEALVYAV